VQNENPIGLLIKNISCTGHRTWDWHARLRHPNWTYASQYGIHSWAWIYIPAEGFGFVWLEDNIKKAATLQHDAQHPYRSRWNRRMNA
jgi:hypothetical protein